MYAGCAITYRIHFPRLYHTHQYSYIYIYIYIYYKLYISGFTAEDLFKVWREGRLMTLDELQGGGGQESKQVNRHI